MSHVQRSYHNVLLLVLMLLIISMKVNAEDNMVFHGALVAEPCVISADDANVLLNFGTVIDKELYNNTRTRGQEFSVHLLECDLTIGKTVKVTFNGLENPKLKGLLAIDGNSQASGVAIGMEDQKGKLLSINKSGEKISLANGSNILTIRAFVEGEPEAIMNHTIERGPFSAVATFSLEYE